jgi:hypothetical protein
LSGVTAAALALFEADVRAARRGSHGHPAAPWISGVASALVAAGAVAVGVALGAVVGGWRASGALEAAAGATDVALAALLASAVVAPLLGVGASRVRACARGSRAPVGGAAVLLATAAREVCSAPLALSLSIALGAVLGRTVADGPLAAAHAVVVVTALAGFGVAVGGWLAAWTDGHPRSRNVRVLVALLVVTAVAALAGGGGSASSSVDGWLAAVHAARPAAIVSPSGWAAAALDGGAAATWAPLGLVALAGWAAAGASRHTYAVASHRGDAARTVGSSLWGRPRSVTGVLVVKDVVLLRREPAIRRAALRHGAPVAAVLLAVVWFAASARGDPVATARAARWVPGLGLIAHLVVVSLTGVVALLPGLDGGGRATMGLLPVGARPALHARWRAWTLVVAPLVATASAIVVAVAAGLVGASVVGPALRAALEAVASVAAGAGAGLLAGTLRTDGPLTAFRPLAGLGGALLTLVVVLPVAALFHGVGGVSGVVAGCVVGTLSGAALTRLAAAFSQARAEPGRI